MDPLEQLRAEQDEIRTRMREIVSETEGEYIDPESERGQEWAELDERFENNKRTIEQRERLNQRMEQVADDPAQREDPPAPTRSNGSNGGAPAVHSSRDIYDLSTINPFSNPERAVGELRDRARRSVDEAIFYGPGADDDLTKRSLETQVSEDADSQGTLSRYILATGSPTYKRAFGKVLAGAMLNREEQVSVEQAKMAERALSLTGASGGFAVPYVLDPTLILTGGGVVNPIRQLATVKQITVDEWRGVTTAGVTAAYEAEATQVADQTPTMVQPTISTEKAQAWVAASIEINQDWTGLQQELATLFADAKETLEADKFVTGTGTNEPFGVLVGTTNTVNATTGQTFTLANLYALLGALPPRYRNQPSTAFVGDLLILNLIRQFDTAGGSAVWEPGGIQSGNPDRLLGKPAFEGSAFPDTPATGNKFLLLGSFSRYVIVDRIGMNIEVVPHVFGANQRPTGQRGFYCYWRNGAKVIDAAAFRALIGIA